jgi:hypothetical protein
MALSDDYPALAQLVTAAPPYPAMTAAQTTALAGDAKKAYARLQRFLDTQPFGPGYQRGYSDGAATASGTQPQAKLDVLVNAVRQLCDAVEGFDFAAFEPASLLQLQAICQAVRDQLP